MSILDQFKRSATGHSSTVKMTLYIGSEAYCVLQSSKEAIKLLPNTIVEPGDAMLETLVDGRPHRRLIRVLAGSPRPNWVAIEDRNR